MSDLLKHTLLILALVTACSGERRENADRATSDRSVGPTLTQKVARPAAEESFSCVPGCGLENDQSGRPIVPDWCLAWSPVAPVCVRNGDKTFCVGQWAGAGRIIHKPDTPYTDFHLESPEEIAASPFKPLQEVNFVCTRIDTDAAIEHISTSPKAEGLLGEKRALRCAPGCIVGEGLVSDESKAAKPDWCYRLASEYVYGRNDPNQRELAICTHIRPGSRNQE